MEYVAINETGNEVKIHVRCPQCGRISCVSVNKTDWKKYTNSKEVVLIQSAFPYLNHDDRELLISGICASCWDELFSGFNED